MRCDPGALVDVLVTTDGDSGSAAHVPGAAADPARRLSRLAPATGSPEGADATATLRTTLRQAATLIAAENFAREVRVVPRPPGDLRRLGPTSVSAAALGR